MTEDEKTLLQELVRHPGWKIFTAMNEVEIAGYRQMATQEPGTISDSHRTWYAGKAEGRQELIQSLEERLLRSVDKLAS